MDRKPYKVLESAGRHVAGQNNPGVGNNLFLTDDQAKLALDKKEIKLDKVRMKEIADAAKPKSEKKDEPKSDDKKGKPGKNAGGEGGEGNQGNNGGGAQ